MKIKTKNKYSIENMIKAINELTCTKLKADTYIINTRNEITPDLCKIFNLNLIKEYIKEQKIKNLVK